MWGVYSVGCVQCGVCTVWGAYSVGCVQCGVCTVWGVYSVGCVQCGACAVWGMCNVGCVRCGVCACSDSLLSTAIPTDVQVQLDGQQVQLDAFKVDQPPLQRGMFSST